MWPGSCGASKFDRGWLLLDAEGFGSHSWEVDLVHSWMVWTLPVSKTDVEALGKVRRWECVCSGDLTRPCPFHATVNQLEVLQLSHGGR